MSKSRSALPESLSEIRRRYEDISVVLYKERQKGSRPGNFLNIGETPKSYSYISHGSTAVVVYKRGNDVTKVDEKSVDSRVCAVM